MENSPELLLEAVKYWSAFAELSPSRQVSMSIGSIPYSEISNWLDENNISLIEERILYRRLIVAIDSKFITLQNKSKDR